MSVEWQRFPSWITIILGSMSLPSKVSGISPEVAHWCSPSLAEGLPLPRCTWERGLQTTPSSMGASAGDEPASSSKWPGGSSYKWTASWAMCPNAKACRFGEHLPLQQDKYNEWTKSHVVHPSVVRSCSPPVLAIVNRQCWLLTVIDGCYPWFSTLQLLKIAEAHSNWRWTFLPGDAACNPKPKPTRVHPPAVGLCAAMMVGLDAMANKVTK